MLGHDSTTEEEQYSLAVIHFLGLCSFFSLWELEDSEELIAVVCGSSLCPCLCLFFSNIFRSLVQVCSHLFISPNSDIFSSIYLDN